MHCKSTRLPFRQTGAFSKIALDYLDQDEKLKSFFAHPPSLHGIEQAIEKRKQFPVNREVLVQELSKQYTLVSPNDKVQDNLRLLGSQNTFTITTAHQNNIFSGPLYFIYKILHAIRLADQLRITLPQYQFVPVFYMGTEDADLDELNHIHVGGEKLSWTTNQTGAVGRMKVDGELLKIIDRLEGQLLQYPFGEELISLLRECYQLGDEIQMATFRLVNALFGDMGLVVVLPDNGSLKQQISSIIEDDLLNQRASGIVNQTAERLEKKEYKVQVNPREINIFYLFEDTRERIVEKDGRYFVLNSQFSFTKEEIIKELHEHPERFSPNVILRGMYQEIILPNLVFIGGGGEMAYWLQLKDLFDHYHVPFPILVLRNSFLVVEKSWHDKINRLGFSIDDFFLPGQELINRLVVKESKNEIKLNGSLTELEQLYDGFKKQAAAVDSTLEKHVDALKLRTVHHIQELEKKMLRAEKRKFSDQQRQIGTIKNHLFPGGGLQERFDNISYYYAKWGGSFIKQLYEHSLAFEQEFVVITEQ